MQNFKPDKLEHQQPVDDAADQQSADLRLTIPSQLPPNHQQQRQNSLSILQHSVTHHHHLLDQYQILVQENNIKSTNQFYLNGDQQQQLLLLTSTSTAQHSKCNSENNFNETETFIETAQFADASEPRESVLNLNPNSSNLADTTSITNSNVNNSNYSSDFNQNSNSNTFTNKNQNFQNYCQDHNNTTIRYATPSAARPAATTDDQTSGRNSKLFDSNQQLPHNPNNKHQNNPEESNNKDNNSSDQPNSSIEERLGFQLRAFSDSNSTLAQEIWSASAGAQQQASELATNINVSTLSSELVNETLNYFVNCGKRLSQMTKTYDDNDAYILLLQEKEVDLELAARIGQDLLKQNKQLRDSVQNLETQLSKREDDVNQLRHELANKISLLDTFIEEEEHHQSSLAESLINDISSSKHDNNSLGQQNNNNNNNNNKVSSSSSNQNFKLSTQKLHNHHDHDQPNIDSHLVQHQNINSHDNNSHGFMSLNYNYANRPHCSSAEPFVSLQTTTTSTSNNNYNCYSSSYSHYNTAISNRNKTENIDRSESSDILLGRDDSSSCLFDANIRINGHNHNHDQQHQQQQKLVESVTFRLVESNKRLCELQDELLYKCEQNLMQQEKLFKLTQELSETDRRLDDLASENELLKRAIEETGQYKQELNEELKSCKRNFSELLGVFIEYQKESNHQRRQHHHHRAQGLDSFDGLHNCDRSCSAGSNCGDISTRSTSSTSSGTSSRCQYFDSHVVDTTTLINPAGLSNSQQSDKMVTSSNSTSPPPTQTSSENNNHDQQLELKQAKHTTLTPYSLMGPVCLIILTSLSLSYLAKLIKPKI